MVFLKQIHEPVVVQLQHVDTDGETEFAPINVAVSVAYRGKKC